MFKHLVLLCVVICVIEAMPKWQFLPPRDGYVPVYIRPGDTPLEEINLDLAEAFHALPAGRSAGKHLEASPDTPEQAYQPLSDTDTPELPQKEPESTDQSQKEPESPDQSQKQPESPDQSQKQPESPDQSQKQPESPDQSQKQPESPDQSQKQPESPESTHYHTTEHKTKSNEISKPEERR